MPEPGPKSFDRRTFIRAPLTVPVLLDSASQHLCVRCFNASAGGLLVESDAEVETGTEFEVYFELPNRVAIETRATVRRCQNGRMAVEFTNLDAPTQLALRSYCRLATIRNRPGAPRPYSGQALTTRN
jgi:hypothetical protein